MKTLVIAALVVAAVATPLPDDRDWEARSVPGKVRAVHTGLHHGAVSYIAVPTVHNVAVPVHHYQTSYVVSGGPVPTPEVQQATAAFMAAWNAAAARATKIQSALVKSGSQGHYVVQVPQQVQATHEVQRATSEFMAAWNEAARRASTVKHAVYSAPQPVQETADVKRATEEFMAAWEAAARQASTIKTAVSYTGTPQQVEHTDEVKKATAEFMAAWEKAAARVPKIESTMYSISGTVASPNYQHTAGSTPQFTPSVEQATAEFMKAWNAAAAAAAAAPDVNIIMGAGSAHSGSHSVSYQSPAAVSYTAASLSDLSKPVEPTPEVQRATATFMAAWNKAAAQATAIRSTLTRSTSAGHYTVTVPKQVEATEEVKRATAAFMAAWNEAAGRASTVEHAIYSVPQPVRQTEEVRRATAEFMSAWEAAAQQASAMRQAISYSRVPQQVDHTDAVKKATEEFMAAWEEAAARVPKIESTMYTLSGTVAAPVSHHTVGSAPQFTPSVEQATAEFTRIWNAAAKAAADAPDVNIIMGASSLPSTSHSVTYHAAAPVVAHAPASVSYNAASLSDLSKPVEPTPEVQRATAAFMAAWNKAAAQATAIRSTLTRSSSAGHYTVTVPKQVEATEEVKRATAAFMAAWNEAAGRASTVEHAIYSVPQPVRQTEEVRRATAEFMSAWEAAAQQASAMRQAISYSGVPQQVDHTDAVKKATEEFMAAWEKAAARVPKIESTIYTISGTVPAPGAHHTVGSAPQFTPSVEQATAEFTRIWNAAAKAAADAPDVNIIMGASSLPSTSHSVTYHAAAPVVAHAPASVSYTAASLSDLSKPVEPTPEVQRATATFMAAWNKAAAQATAIRSTLTRSSSAGHYTVTVPKQVEATEEVKRATAAFMAAWNEAAGRASTVEHAIYSVPQPVRQTEEVRRATAEFMSAWEAAAQQASAMRQAISYSRVPQQVDHTDAVKKATEEFMAAWEEAAARVPKIESTMYTLSGTVAAPGSHHTVGSAPQFTPSVEQATAEFTRIWNAAAKAAADAPDVNIIMGASSLPSTSHSVTYHAAAPVVAHAPASISYTAASLSDLSKPVEPTPEVQRATAAFMAAWNKAAAQATAIRSTLTRSSSAGHYTVTVPKQVEATEEVKRATAAFMAAWNEAAGRASTVEHAIYSVPQPVRETEEVRRATAEFMSAWEAAAQQASAMRQAISYSGVPQQVDHTDAVKKATEEFMAAWEKAAARVPKIESTIYTISGTVPAPGAHHTLGSAPQFTPSVQQATAEFTRAWNAAAAAAAAAPDTNIIMGSSRTSSHHATGQATYSTGSAHTYSSSVHVGAPQPVQPTPEVQRATAAFMAAWNAAAERANKIQTKLYKASGSAHQAHIPQQVSDTDAVRKATEEFMAAWNAAARRGVVVEQAISTLPQQVQQTADVKQATAQFMSAWHAAAQQASAIYNVLPSASAYASHQPVTATAEVRKATDEFMAAWNKAAARVPKIESTMYSLSGTGAISGVSVPVVDTPEVTAAREAFMNTFRQVEAAALRTSVRRGLLPAPTVLAAAPVHTVVYSAAAPAQGYTFDGRLFAPVAGLPQYVKPCTC
ncbi:pneumococcal serine-rich repeat protein-like [Palaemon carinicauda]|uniref:pneumococcal serine-rich repeat protein-like n=1 Tax=Palaemon carinicauda TaxID=392227 RepID=UPI0035B5E934